MQQKYPIGTKLRVGDARFEVIGHETKHFNVLNRVDDLGGEGYLMSDASIHGAARGIRLPKESKN